MKKNIQEINKMVTTLRRDINYDLPYVHWTFYLIVFLIDHICTDTLRMTVI